MKNIILLSLILGLYCQNLVQSQTQLKDANWNNILYFHDDFESINWTTWKVPTELQWNLREKWVSSHVISGIEPSVLWLKAEKIGDSESTIDCLS